MSLYDNELIKLYSEFFTLPEKYLENEFNKKFEMSINKH